MLSCSSYYFFFVPSNNAFIESLRQVVFVLLGAAAGVGLGLKKKEKLLD